MRAPDPDDTAQQFVFCEGCKTLWLGGGGENFAHPCGFMVGQCVEGGVRVEYPPVVTLPFQFAHRTRQLK
jgi:hypothetical protein